MNLNFLNKLPFESAVIALAIIKGEFNFLLKLYAMQIVDNKYNFVNAYAGINLKCPKDILHECMLKELQDDINSI